MWQSDSCKQNNWPNSSNLSLPAESGDGSRGRAASQGDWVPLSSSQTAATSQPAKESAEITKDAGSEKENLRGAVGGAKSVEIKENVTRTKVSLCVCCATCLWWQLLLVVIQHFLCNICCELYVSKDIGLGLQVGLRVGVGSRLHVVFGSGLKLGYRYR